MPGSTSKVSLLSLPFRNGLEGSIYDWMEELELQRRTLVVLASMDASTLTGSLIGLGAGARLPVWAQVAKAQALESFALRAPRDRELRVAVYDSNIIQVSRESKIS